MTFASLDAAGAVTPDVAYAALQSDAATLLVDVRTRAEWAFVGGADLTAIGRPQCFIEWLAFPAMAPNAGFLDALEREVDASGARTVYFICRSGARSHDAAVAAAEHFAAKGQPVACINVLEGFEGPLDGHGHRGVLAGWKARGLPWRQS